MSNKAIFIAATGQHVGKTTTSLGIFSGLLKRFKKVGFLKPVGQRYVQAENDWKIDKDVELFRKHFDLQTEAPQMSPVLLPKGFTRKYLDGELKQSNLEHKIFRSFEKISQENDYCLVEGTGHLGVGSIAGLNNAYVAKLLGLDVIIVAPGGIGSSFDELVLNITLCEKYDVKIRGVILNKVIEEKMADIEHYMAKALKQLNIPLIGAVPFQKLLSAPSFYDLAQIFKTNALSGQENPNLHFLDLHFISMQSSERYHGLGQKNLLIVTHCSRKDILEAFIEKNLKRIEKDPQNGCQEGLLITGGTMEENALFDKAKAAKLPIINVKENAYQAMERVSQHIGKLRNEDPIKITRAIDLVESHLNFDLIAKAPQSISRS